MLTTLKTKTKRSKIDWTDPRFKIMVQLALHGFHGQLIAKHSEFTRSQVYYYLQKLGIQLRDYRNGKTDPARPIIKKYSIRTITPIVSKQLEKQSIIQINF